MLRATVTYLGRTHSAGEPPTGGGASVANLLARRGWDVLLLDKDEFPSTTVSTHVPWPRGVARLEQLRVLERLDDGHELPMFDFRIRDLGTAR